MRHAISSPAPSVPTRILLALSLLLAMLLSSPRVAGAQCVTNTDAMWPLGCGYTGTSSAPIPIPSPPVVIRGLALTDLAPLTPVPPVGGFFVDSFFDVFVELSLDNGATFTPRHASGHERTQLNITSPPATNPRIYDTEMLQLDISGGTLPAGMRLRESPTHASQGFAQDTDIGGGQFKIDSFFDIFVELSTDNGVTWIPASQSTRMVLGVSQPTPVRASTWGALKSFYR